MRLIKQLVVNCCNEGCSWQGCLSSLLQGHQNNCNFSIRRGDDLDKKVEQLVQTLETQLMLKISTLEIKHQQDIKELKLKHEQDIKELKLKVISTYEEDIKELELKVISTYEEDIKELKLKLQQSENRLQLLEEKEKELCEKEKQAAVCCTSIFCNVIFCYDEQELTAERFILCYETRAQS
ncbi:Hypothetical predicted protein [Paramuricea clavata]|uniref:Uncharacterized protein n=2 Tax=Paramuricea clavata TaxID=317549 RepID=A0A7D9JY80_PARCT|nr:Hypothetical predicted protein [Paramuricea clavata]